MKIFLTLPLVYILLHVVRLPFFLLGDNVNIWWGSIAAAFGMLPGVGLIYLVHQFQQYRPGSDAAEQESKGPYASLLALLALIYFFYLIRGPAILLGFQGPFDSVANAVGPYINWILGVPEWAKKLLM